jgi:hypothetical protein
MDKVMYDVEFDLVSGVTGRAIVISNSIKKAIELLNAVLLEQGYSIDDNDRHDVIALDFDYNDKAILIGIEK